jgi:hypothetical protein
MSLIHHNLRQSLNFKKRMSVMKLKWNIKKQAFATAALFGVMTISIAHVPNSNAAKEFKGETIETSTEVTATVQEIDYKSREVTLKTKDGEEYTILAGENVQRLNDIKKGDTVTAVYTEAIVYDINKGGKAVAPVTKGSVSRSTRPGGRPQAMVAREVTETVVISAIDRKIPTVTFKEADGDIQTIKVMHPEKLKGVNVGDAVDITYSEALALKVDKKMIQ